MHEFGARRNHVRIKLEATFILAFIKDDLVLPTRFDSCLVRFLFFCVFGCAEASRSLLVLLCTGSHSVDCQVEHLLGLHEANDLVRVLGDVVIDFLFTPRLWCVLRVGTWVNDTVHVEVEVVDLRIVLLDLTLDHLDFFAALGQGRGHG